MYKRLSARHRKVIVSEIEQWFDQGLVDAKLANVLLLQYANGDQKPNLAGAMTIAGAILVGLGVILLVASNWHVMAQGFKLLLIVGAIVSSYYLGFRFRFQTGTRPKLGDAFLVMGALFYGAGIWLVSQIFNIDTQFADGLLIWALGVMASTFALRSVPLGITTSILLSMWSMNFAGSFEYDRLSLGQFVTFVLAFAMSAVLGKYLRSRVVVWVTLCFGAIWCLVFCPFHSMALYLYGLTGFAFYLWFNQNHKLFSRAFMTVGVVSVLAPLAFFASNGVTVNTGSDAWMFGFLMLVTLVSSMVMAWQLPAFRYEAITCSVLALVPSLMIGLSDSGQRIGFNLVFLVLIVAMIHSGLNRLKSPALVNFAIVFFVVDILCRYFDIFFTMIDRSLFFLLGGIVLMTIGAVAETKRRELLAGIEV